eukprot:TRINITY_DN2079_c0_g1_i3.p1 TRINITY_DN2079_c0_g1~~TRINITY_DN2079_c0_g1_i3.p1  ORF type:complete len:220 (-),score=72.81 TRINITY_DN2079_c0_g1_i3:30-641(-)
MEEEKMDFDFSIADSLRQDKFFASLSKEDAERVKEKLTKKQVSKGEVLYKEGEPQKIAIVIESGRLEKSRKDGETSTLEAGSIAGFLHLINSDPSFATLTAKEDSVIWTIDSETFSKLLQEDKSINKSYISFLSKQLREHSHALQNIRTKLGSEGTLKIAFFDTKPYMQEAFEKVKKDGDYNFKIKWIMDKPVSYTHLTLPTT